MIQFKRKSLFYHFMSIAFGLILSFSISYADSRTSVIPLSYLDLLASKLWSYSQYNNEKLLDMVHSDINAYAEIFTPVLYQKYQNDPKALKKHVQMIVNILVMHLNHFYQSQYYVEKTVPLGQFDLKTLSFNIDIPRRFYINYQGNHLPYSINGYNFTPSYYVDLTGNYNAAFAYPKNEGLNLEKLSNEACLRVFLKPNSLSLVTDALHSYSRDNYTAMIDHFQLTPNKRCGDN